jgi:hypothetical protein
VNVTACLAGIDHEIDVVVEQAETMELVGRLLDVGDGHGDDVTLANLERRRRQRRADGDHLYRHLVPLPGDSGLVDVPDGQRVVILFFRIHLDGMELIRLDDLRVVRLGLRERVVEQLHLLL